FGGTLSPNENKMSCRERERHIAFSQHSFKPLNILITPARGRIHRMVRLFCHAAALSAEASGRLVACTARMTGQSADEDSAPRMRSQRDWRRETTPPSRERALATGPEAPHRE